MISYLKNKRITVVTTNAMVVPSILETDIHVIMIGGDVLKSTASIVGSITDNSLKDMFFDKAFIGATGYDLQSGINTPDSREANKKRIIKENSSEVYVLADSSKSGKRTMCKAMELSECTIITEQETELLKEHANYILAKD
jgi:DeoR family fructose operon transcriptional repressor